ncbi:MAG: hypothetical protein WD114_00335 [Phycisphaerales bacterium]
MRSVAFLLSLLLASPVLARTPLPADALESVRVQRLVEQLDDAVGRADSGAYMALIDPTDPVFATEQRAWANDLRAHPVEDIELSLIGDEPVRLLEDGSAAARIQIRWRVPGEDEPRSVSYEAAFRPVGAPGGQWVMAGRAWGVSLLDTPGVRVYAEPEHEQLALLARSRVPELRDAIAENMGVASSEDSGLHEVVVKIFPDMASLQASIFLSYTDPLSGWNEPGESIKILGRENFPQHRLDPLLAHEIGHAVSFEFGPEIIEAPWWALEGIAEVAANLFRDSWERRNERITRLAREDDLRDWSLLADFRGEAMNHGRHVYLQGWSMVDFIDRTFGVDARNAWFAALGNGGTLDEATESALGIGFAELDARWRASLLEEPADEGPDSD